MSTPHDSPTDGWGPTDHVVRIQRERLPEGLLAVVRHIDGAKVIVMDDRLGRAEIRRVLAALRSGRSLKPAPLAHQSEI